MTADATIAAQYRIVDAYGAVPEFVLLGGLVPDLLCSRPSTLHVGTTDVDVQVNLEIAGGSVNAARLEAALQSRLCALDQRPTLTDADERVALYTSRCCAVTTISKR